MAIKTFLNFGGFQQSDHGVAIDSWVQPDYESGMQYDWHRAHERYANFYVDWFNETFDLSLKLLGVWSPQDYVFRTDALEVEVSEEDAKEIKRIVSGALPDKLEEVIEITRLARAGYDAQTVVDDHDRLLEVYLTTLARQTLCSWWEYYNDDLQDLLPEPDEFLL